MGSQTDMSSAGTVPPMCATWDWRLPWCQGLDDTLYLLHMDVHNVHNGKDARVHYQSIPIPPNGPAPFAQILRDYNVPLRFISF